jgi:hypothetical protein
MDDLQKNEFKFGREKDIIYSKAIKAGKRIYYLDVKQNLSEELFITITESKKVVSQDGNSFSLQKHKVFLYHEDFDKFIDGLQEIVNCAKEHKATQENGIEDIESGPIRLDMEIE